MNQNASPTFKLFLIIFFFRYFSVTQPDSADVLVLLGRKERYLEFDVKLTKSSLAVLFWISIFSSKAQAHNTFL